MKPIARCFTVLFSVIAAVALGCGDDTVTPPPPPTPGPTDPVAITGIITVPGNPTVSSTKTWVDDATKRLYVTDVSNAGVDVIDAKTLAYVGRVPGFIGTGAAAATSGPNSIVFSGDGKAWVSDGIAVARVVDLTTLTITATISTAILACDNGVIHNCQRTNEISYDPEHKIIFIQNPSPLDLTGAAIDTYGTFISAVSPYPVLGTITFVDRRGQEAPLYDASQHRFLTAVSGRLVGTTYYDQYVAVIDPTVIPFVVEKKYTIDCFALGIGTSLGSTFGINDPALSPYGHMVIPGCGKALIMNTTTGAITPILQVGGGNETWYNSGDGRYYTTGVDITNGVNSLGVIDAATKTWVQSVPALQATNPAAFAETNTMFAAVQVNAGQVATPSTDNSACAAVGGPQGKGCILVFRHVVSPSAGLNAMPKVVPADAGVVADDD
jgi:hypothetical protein